MASQSSPSLSSPTVSEMSESSFSVSSTPARETEGLQSQVLISSLNNHSNNETSIVAALEVLEKHVEFMSFFYQHITGCPPHGPFRLYCAITFVERARRRFNYYSNKYESKIIDNMTTSENNRNVEENKEYATTADMYLHTSYELAKLCGFITIRNILALIDKHFNTRHLNSWALLYVPAEIHLRDVERLVQQQKQQHQQQESN